MIAKSAAAASAFDTSLLLRALRDAVVKLNPTKLVRNPVIFVTEVVAAFVTFIAIRDALAGHAFAFNAQLAAWLWFTVLFATFAEAVAEGRGRAQADALRKLRSDVTAKVLLSPDNHVLFERRAAADLHEGDVVLVTAGDIIPADGEVIEGVASVNESAVTGESAPVIRESGGDRSAVTAARLSSRIGSLSG